MNGMRAAHAVHAVQVNKYAFSGGGASVEEHREKGECQGKRAWILGALVPQTAFLTVATSPTPSCTTIPLPCGRRGQPGGGRELGVAQHCNN